MTGTYSIDPARSRIGFAVRSAVVTKVRGTFKQFAGTGYFDADDPSRSRLELTIHPQSIDTRNARRDAHLRSNAFFGVEEHREIRFISTAVARRDDWNYCVAGDLTIKGITNRVTVDFDLTGAAHATRDHRIRFAGTAVVNRYDWGVKWNAVVEGGGALVGKKVTLDFEVSAIRTGE
jgi:polyisoprenoid-binding protein YceI